MTGTILGLRTLPKIHPTTTSTTVNDHLQAPETSLPGAWGSWNINEQVALNSNIHRYAGLSRCCATSSVSQHSHDFEGNAAPEPARLVWIALASIGFCCSNC